MGLVIFDMDGVLVDSEQVWDQARRDVVDAHGGTWKDSATRDMLGMSSKEWSVYVVEELGAQLSPEQVNDAVVEAMLRGYEAHLPLLPGAREAIERLGARHTLGLASSSNRPVIDVVLETMGVTDRFAATVSSEEVARGKPAPDVYLEAMRRLGSSEGVRDRGLRERDQVGPRGRPARDRHPQPALPARGRGARAGRRDPAGPGRGAAVKRASEQLSALSDDNSTLERLKTGQAAANASSRVACSVKREAVPVISSSRRTGPSGATTCRRLPVVSSCWAARRIVPSALESMKSTADQVEDDRVLRAGGRHGEDRAHLRGGGEIEFAAGDDQVAAVDGVVVEGEHGGDATSAATLHAAQESWAFPHERREVTTRTVERVEQRRGRVAAVHRRAVTDEQVLGQERLEAVRAGRIRRRKCTPAGPGPSA